MPYSVNGSLEKWHQLLGSLVYTDAALLQLYKSLSKVRFDKVNSREDGRMAYDTFSDSAQFHSEIVGDRMRYPLGRRYTTMDSETREVLATIRSALEWRDTNAAKDTKVHQTIAVARASVGGSGNAQDTMDQTGLLGQSYQDAAKSFAEAYKRLMGLFAGNVYYREKIENLCELVWVEPVQQNQQGGGHGNGGHGNGGGGHGVGGIGGDGNGGHGVGGDGHGVGGDGGGGLGIGGLAAQ